MHARTVSGQEAHGMEGFHAALMALAGCLAQHTTQLCVAGLPGKIAADVTPPYTSTSITVVEPSCAWKHIIHASMLFFLLVFNINTTTWKSFQCPLSSG